MVSRCYDNLFEQAPVMLHSIDEFWKLIWVNRKWLETLGYEAGEVLGRRSIDFFANDSRAVAESETLPLFWRTGSARSIGVEIVRKDGRVLDVLLDADLDTDSAGNRHTLTAIRERSDPAGWQWSSAILGSLLGLAKVRRAIEAILLRESSSLGAAAERGDPLSEAMFEGPAELVANLLEAVSESSKNLRALGSILAGSAHPMAGKDSDLVLLAEKAVEVCGRLPWLTTSESADA